ncbi:MAG: M24 family metallopeptidase [Vicinamibacterales bacterium]
MASAELDTKTERVARLARESRMAGILLATQHNFAWLTGGRSNRVDASRERGNGELLVAADGRRFVLANTIESSRVSTEALDGLDCRLIEYSWTDERADPSLSIRLAQRALGADAIGADVVAAPATFLEPQIARLRVPLVPEEVERYRALGREAGDVVGGVVRTLQPGVTEREVAAVVGSALVARGIRPVVLLIGADDRIARYRHPVATGRVWRHRLLVACCAERDGLVVALSRLVSATPVDGDLAARTRATADVFAALLDATRASVTGARLFETAASAYVRAGFPGEERRHHQGGAIGYRAREWVAHPASQDAVRPPQAFAWNPSITGTKVEETCLVDEEDRIEIITTSSDWPSSVEQIRGTAVRIPDVLELG